MELILSCYIVPFYVTLNTSIKRLKEGPLNEKPIVIFRNQIYKYKQ
jgi:hypothetical protein